MLLLCPRVVMNRRVVFACWQRLHHAAVQDPSPTLNLEPDILSPSTLCGCFSFEPGAVASGALRFLARATGYLPRSHVVYLLFLVHHQIHGNLAHNKLRPPRTLQ